MGRRLVVFVAVFGDAADHPLELNLEKKFEVTLRRAILMDPRFRQVIPRTFVIAFHVLCQCVATGGVGMILGGLLQKRCP